MKEKTKKFTMMCKVDYMQLKLQKIKGDITLHYVAVFVLYLMCRVVVLSHSSSRRPYTVAWL